MSIKGDSEIMAGTPMGPGLEDESLSVKDSPLLRENLIQNSLNLGDWINEVDLRKSQVKQPSVEINLSEPAAQPPEYPSFFVKLYRRITRSLLNEDFFRVLQTYSTGLASKKMLGAYVDLPLQGEQGKMSTVHFSGWVMGKETQPRIIRLVAEGKTLTESEINLPRPDVSQIYCITDEDKWGYFIPLSVALLPEEGVIELEAEFPDRQTESIGFVRFCKY